MNRSCMAARLVRLAGCFRAPQNLSSTFRPGSIPILIRCRAFAGIVRAPAGSGCARLPRRHCRQGLRRAVGGSCRAGAWHADFAAVCAGAGSAGTRRDPGADLFRTCACRGACRARGRRGRRYRRRWPMPTSLLSPIPTIRTAGSLPWTIWSPWPRNCSRAAACSWSMKPSWMSGRPAAASAARCRAATSSCCGRSANSSGSPACGSALHLPRRRLPRGLPLCSAPGRSPAPALEIGAQALADRAWIDATRRGLAIAAARLDAILTGCGLDIAGGTTLFRLARTPAARELFHHLGRAGIWTRVFPEHATWLRFGLPAAEPDWPRLQIAMAAFRDNR